MYVKNLIAYKDNIKAFSSEVLGIKNYWESYTNTAAAEIIYNLIFKKRIQAIAIFQENRIFFEYLKELIKKIPPEFEYDIFQNRIQIASSRIMYINKNPKTQDFALRGYSLDVLVLDAADSKYSVSSVIPNLRSNNGVILSIDSRFIK